MADLDEVLTLCRKNGRVCPMPNSWQEMFKRLEVDGVSPFDREDLMVPLILGGWWATGDGDKVHRLEHQVRWAESHGVLKRIAHFLARLPETEWHHSSGFWRERDSTARVSSGIGRAGRPEAPGNERTSEARSDQGDLFSNHVPCGNTDQKNR